MDTVEGCLQLVTYHRADFCAHDIAVVDPLVLEQEFNRLRSRGGHHRKSHEARPLSGMTVRAVASILHSAFRAALRWRFLRFNPIEAVQLPKIEQNEKEVLDTAQTNVLLEATTGHWIHPSYMFAAATVSRHGEMLALQWADLDLVKLTATVRQSLERTKAGLRVKSPKNGRPRLIHLPGSLVESLREHKINQDGNRRMFGADYRADLDLVFADPSGGHLKPDSVTATACLMAGEAGLKCVGLHSLRHRHGPNFCQRVFLCRLSGKDWDTVHPTSPQETYAHSFKADEVDAARIWDESVGPCFRIRVAILLSQSGV